MDDMADTSHGWIAWTAAALLASLTHVLIDSHIGLYGETSSQMSLLQAANVLLTSLFYGWAIFAVGLASMGNKSALVSTLVIVVVWVLLANGAAIALAPPPSSAFPYQDIAHVSCIVFGVGASAAIWRARRSIAGEVSWSMPITTGITLLLAFVVQSVLGLQNI